MVEISANACVQLGWSEDHRKALLEDWVHPEDVQVLLDTLAAAHGDNPMPPVNARIRGRADKWFRAQCVVSPLMGRDPARYVVTLRLFDRGAEPADIRALRLEGHLWRIALEVQAAGLGGQPGQHEAWWADPALAGLSERQAEILRRVVRGEHVQDIADDLVITESTVRNHLSGIYRKFGVHSQAALMLRLMPRESDEATPVVPPRRSTRDFH